VLVVEVAREDRVEDVLDQVGLDQRLLVEPVAVLRGDEHADDLDGPLAPVLVHLVAHRDLRLPVGAQVREDLRLAHLRKPLRDLVREHDREGHQLLGLGAGVAEHHPLVARADLVDRVVVAVLHLVGGVHALRDVRRLLVERDDDAARVRVEAVLGPVVADLLDLRPDDARDVHVRLRRDLARDDDQAGRDEGLAGDAPVRIVGEDVVEDRVRDLVGDLVRMTLRHGLRGEEELSCGHSGEKGSGGA
jgi:hypothetical protein